MRYKTFKMRTEYGNIWEKEFDASHYKEMGFGYSTQLEGMPILEAHQLVNKWNRISNLQNDYTKYVYWLE